jgi:hypothetical protein
MPCGNCLSAAGLNPKAGIPERGMNYAGTATESPLRALTWCPTCRFNRVWEACTVRKFGPWARVIA